MELYQLMLVAVLGFMISITVSYSSCTGHGVVFDECHKECVCKDGYLTKCTRIRKEFTEMTIEERIRFINAFKVLASSPTYKKRFEKFVVIHKDKFFQGIHTSRYFLPWHRWYLLAFENLLREVDCRVTVPYWDWAFWSNAAWQENIHIWNGKEYGLGGDGDPKRGYCVQDGPFSEREFKTPSFDNPVHVLKAVSLVKEKSVKLPRSGNRSSCLRRSFNGKPIGVPAIRKLLTQKASSFWRFERAVRLVLHNSMHLEIGGHMCSMHASVAPEFYLHHAFLDKVWYTWQQQSNACMKARFSNMSQRMLRLECPYSQKELLDSSSLPGQVRVAYTDYYYSARKSEMKNHRFTKKEKPIKILKEREINSIFDNSKEKKANTGKYFEDHDKTVDESSFAPFKKYRLVY